MEKRRLGDLLLEHKHVDEEGIRTALEAQKRSGEPLGSTLVRLNLVDRDVVTELLGQQLGVTAVDPETVRPEVTALDLLSLSDVMRLGALPLRVRDGELVVAMTNPSDEEALGELKNLTGLRIVGWVAPQMALYEAVKRAYGVRKSRRESQESTEARLRRLTATLRGVLAELEAMGGE
ncbi:MAG: hypothetical protein GY906_00285 [bacterium]|nr:hypothetical protein [bacterium]